MLDALDSMAFSAMRFCQIKSSALRGNEEGMSSVMAALVASGNGIGGLEAEIWLPDGDQARTTTIRSKTSVDSTVLPAPHCDGH